MKIGIAYYPGKNKNEVSFESLNEAYSTVLDGDFYAAEQTNLQASPFEISYFPTVVIYDFETKKELDRLECNFTIEDFKTTLSLVKNEKRSIRFLGISKYNFKCFVAKNWLILLLVLIALFFALKSRT